MQHDGLRAVKPLENCELDTGVLGLSMRIGRLWFLEVALLVGRTFETGELALLDCDSMQGGVRSSGSVVLEEWRTHRCS